MEDITKKEIKYILRRYIALPYAIEQLEIKYQSIQFEVYRRQSLIGVSQYGFSINDYTHSVNIENFALNLVMEQEAVMRHLNRLKLRYRLFKEVMPLLDYPKIKTLLKHDTLTDYEKLVYREIQEIDYYIYQHNLTQTRSEVEDETTIIDLNEKKLQHILSDSDSNNIRQDKITTLNNAEEELLAMLN